MQTICIGPLCMHPLPPRFIQCETHGHSHAHILRKLVNKHCLHPLLAKLPSHMLVLSCHHFRWGEAMWFRVSNRHQEQKQVQIWDHASAHWTTTTQTNTWADTSRSQSPPASFSHQQLAFPQKPWQRHHHGYTPWQPHCCAEAEMPTHNLLFLQLWYIKYDLMGAQSCTCCSQLEQWCDVGRTSGRPVPFRWNECSCAVATSGSQKQSQ